MDNKSEKFGSSEPSVLINKEKILKISKKLYQKLNNKDLTLSLVQEELSKSLGFRNWQEGQTNLSQDNIKKEKDVVINTKLNNNLLEILNIQELTKILTIYSQNEKNDIWLDRAVSLAEAVANIIKNINNEGELLYLNIKDLLELRNLNNIFYCYIHKFDDLKSISLNKIDFDLKKDLKNDDWYYLDTYIDSVPSYMNAIKHNQKLSETILEQHEFLRVIIFKNLVIFKNLENNFKIYDKKWLLKKDYVNFTSYMDDSYLDSMKLIEERRKDIFWNLNFKEGEIYFSELIYLYVKTLNNTSSIRLRNFIKNLILNINVYRDMEKLFD